MRWKTPKIYIPLAALAIAVIIFIILLVARPKTETFKNTAPSWPAEIATLKVTSISPQIVLYGVVQSPRFTRLEASITAFVEKTPALTGSKVKKGQLLIQLDERDARIVFLQRQAEVNNLKAQIEAEKKRYQSDQKALEHEKNLYRLSKQDLERFRKLELGKYISATEIDKAVRDMKKQALLITQRQLAIENHKHRYAQIVAKLNQAKAMFDKAKLDLERTKIIAPFDGQVTHLKVSVGDRVQPGEVLLEMYDNKAIEIKTQIPQRWLTAVHKAYNVDSKEITATAVYHKQTVKLKLERLSGLIGTGQAAMEAIFVLTSAHPLPIGASVKLIIDLPKLNNVFAVPATSIYSNNRAYKVVKNKLQAVDIENLGQHFKNNKQLTIIRSKQLKNGDKVLITHLPNAITGLKVTPKNAKGTD